MALPSDQQPQTETPLPLPEGQRSSPISAEKIERILWRGNIGPAFWNIASIFSLTVNLVLFIVIIILGRELFAIKGVLEDKLISELYTSFVDMGNAHIQTEIVVEDTIQVNDTIPVVFDLPLQQDTTVTLTTDTSVKNATIFLNGQAVPLDLILKKGTQLDIALDLIVPVNQTVPVVLNVPIHLKVPVDIALSDTDLHDPFVGLQKVVSPYHNILGDLPDSWYATPLCGPNTIWLCEWLLGPEKTD